MPSPITRASCPAGAALAVKNVALATYWEQEAESYRGFVAATGRDYRAWQPAKWQSLGALLDRVLARTEELGDSRVHSAVELGCGSATLLIHLALVGVRCVGVDREPAALDLASAIAASFGVEERVTFTHGDFLEPADARHVLHSDLVLSGGVIEHWDVEGQLEVLDAHCRLSQRWVLIGVPNLGSPVFNSFVKWAERTGRLYDDYHYDISVPDLATRLGHRVVMADGCHVFFGKSEYYVAHDPELDAFYNQLRVRLIAAGGSRYAAFPYLDFDGDDVSVLSRVESSLGVEDRKRYGFMSFYLVDVNAGRAQA